ncbi:MAG: 5-demethoxyubiquinol-8 5-hydroxylase UbiM [Alphaproteobacteria bacterium]|jgi:ubiquinone biosynthesis UbiH/UbiF/VisC/COQ6 family hydroxylase|nr:5-demethoxyubiquinol-8 5-hydroxylase UbiM [Alphaproteobacteria bacterium]MBP9868063.1 5-demethoxyubiquinol-8 5-hydroxylase UbiM [Alphaproteobacteria bacterium]
MTAKPSKKSSLSYDVIIIGGGPAGLSFARALADTDLKICVIEKQSEKILASPPEDGRDIALTHLSLKIMQELGIWSEIPAKEISPIREARVLNGTSSYFLGFDSENTGKEALGYLVPNFLIRRAAYQSVKPWKNIDLMTDISVTETSTDEARGTVTLSNGVTLTAPLIVAADSRFSETRRKMGIPAQMRDFGRVVIVGRMEHDLPHQQIAYECFHYDQTLAILPMNRKQSSIVITLPTDKVAEVMGMDEEEFNTDIEMRFENRLGTMRRIGKLHPYPLVAVYADKFYANRFALMGDAAVGMHPVTAHGFNFGLRGADTLAKEIKNALHLGLDIGANSVLEAYHTEHRRATHPIYLGTNALVWLYTNTHGPAKFLRSALLKVGNILPPVRSLITGQLTETPRNKNAA